jgi:hypothetical protein
MTTTDNAERQGKKKINTDRKPNVRLNINLKDSKTTFYNVFYRLRAKETQL